MAFVHGLLTRMAPEIVNKPGYRADIDALRGLAVAGGVLCHFFPRGDAAFWASISFSSSPVTSFVH